MTKNERRIQELQDYIARDLKLIEFHRRTGHARDEQYAADRLHGVEKELARLVNAGLARERKAAEGEDA
jgi:hypothetical protein